jgi:uncharacterized protein DUF6627
MKSNACLPRLLIAMAAVVMSAQAPMVRAEMIGTDAMSAQNQAEQDRAKVQSFLDRGSVKDRLQAMGVDGVVAKNRVGALSDQEVHALAQRIDSMPAGGYLTNTEIIIILLVAILVVLVI